MKCLVCRRLTLKPCRASRFCAAWARAHELLEKLVYVPEGSVRYSKAAGKFVVPLFHQP